MLTDTLNVAAENRADGQAQCTLGAECRFCDLERYNDLFGELYGRSQLVNLPNIPDSLQVAMDCFPLGHRGAHLLLVPKRHYQSLSQFPNRGQLIAARNTIAEKLQSMHPDHWLFFFEHGPGEIDGRLQRCGGCHVDHAHGHVLLLPVEVEFEDLRERVELALERLGWDVMLQRTISNEPFIDIADASGSAPYLHIGTMSRHDGVSYTYQQSLESQSIPSQLLRRLIAEAAGFPQPTHWNWKIVMQHRLNDRLAEFAADVDAFHADLGR